ncbi:MAG: (E)-4-hydroxy-3-methylbut-2-enyl-diphosphate synthase [Puniceicoccales bacterium]|jgi:(E)-4-hydroxy-3-methylbut-2-enyl-diphosphate synthase|nr:(E)-4-hydroxy-3-methylbut-2-enyl-diphosphate synthase [Puniceicoccales bacterium]
MTIERRQSDEIQVGNVPIGGGNCVRIQSMTNVPTSDVDGNVAQIRALSECGCEIVRLAIGSFGDVKSLAEIKKILRTEGPNVPLVADVHFSPAVAVHCLAVADKVRINAGNFSDKIVAANDFSDEKFKVGKHGLREKLKPFFSKAKEEKKPVRIGVNHGSLAPRIIYKFGDGDVAMWESALECIGVANEVGFRDIVLSFKASDVRRTVSANRFACARMDELGLKFPMHLGVTESGNGDYASVKSAIGIGALLVDGIGDTVRLSITGDPMDEISLAKHVLQACGLRRFGAEVVACPSCGRTSYDIQSVLTQVKAALAGLKNAENLKIAVMGCVINGIGEAGDADFAIVGNPNGTLSLYRGRNCIEKNVPLGKICEMLLLKMRSL